MPYPCLSLTAKFSRILTATLALAGFTFLFAAFAQAQTETTLYDFGTTAPSGTFSGLVSDAVGNFYGVSPAGGSGGHGVVFELSLVNGNWQATVLYNFTGGTDGAGPYATPIFDAAGNLYGTAAGGGAHGYGVVFKLSPSASGWQQSVLYSFTGGNDGMAPMLGNLVMDKAGNLFGSNAAGANLTSEACQNTNGCGVIFELSPVAKGQYKFNLVHTFTGGWDGVGPAFLTFDSKGTLYGAAAGAWGGWEMPNGPGLIFKLTPTTSGPWKDSAIHAFNGTTDGGGPSGVVFDKAGNMYGTASYGGIINNCWSGYGPIGCGVVFQLTPQANGKWKETSLYAFTGGADGSQPDAGLVIDKGILYGPTWGGGISNGGVVFQLSPNQNGGWTESVTHSFIVTDGALPRSALIVDHAGNLFGTTYAGGTSGFGVAFEITP